MTDIITTTGFRTVTARNPATGEVLRKFECATPGQVYQAVDSARAAQKTWAATDVNARKEILHAFIRELHARKSEVAVLISRETGKPLAEALVTEVVVALDAADFLLRELPRFLRPERVGHANPMMKARRSYLLREAYGVVGVISPWNYPFSIPAVDVLNALMCGNGVVLKPSEFTPLIALKLKELFDAAGLPAGLLRVIIGDGLTGASLTQAPPEHLVDKLIFTGSVSTGKRIARAAAENLLPVVLELGGKDPMIVLEDANLETATSAAVWGAFMNAGQTCLSVERCYVHRSLFDNFVKRCVEKTSQLRVRPKDGGEYDVGPLIHAGQADIVDKQVQEAVAAGAKIECGGRRLDELGMNYYTPTVITGINSSLRLMCEETFGPVLPIIPFDNDDEAISMANDSEFGLAASVWTGDLARGEALARRIQAGAVMVNDVITSFGISEAPHGGVKSSGMGRTHGRAGLGEMVRLKYVDADRMGGVAKAWWFGYGDGYLSQMEGFADFMFSSSIIQRLQGGWRSIGAYFRKGRV